MATPAPTPKKQSRRFEYDVTAVANRTLGRGQSSEVRLRKALDEHAAVGWQLRFISTERDRLLVTFERPVDPN